MGTQVFFTKKFITTGLLVLFSVLFLGYFTQIDKVNPIFQTFLVSIAFFLVVPVLYCKMVLKEPLENIGWHRGNVFWGVFLGIVSVAIGLSAIIALAMYTSFRQHFFFPVSIQSNFLAFVLYEALLVPFTVLLYEVFFRGLIQRLWLHSIGLWAVLFQAGFFVGLLYLADDLSWQRLPVLLFAPFSGLIMYYSGSLWYSSAASFLFLFLTDVFLLVSH